MAETLDVVVIGGGLAGIAATAELNARGRKVLLLERETRLGGKAGSTDTDVGEFPTGPASFNGRVPAFWKLIELLGLESEVVKLSPHSSARYVVRGRRLRGLRPHPLSVLFTRAVSLAEKFALAREFFFPRRYDAPADEPLRALLERRFGRSVVEHFLEAVMTGIFAGDLGKLSARACMPALATAEREYGSVLKGALASMRQPPAGTRAGLYTFQRGFRCIGDRAKEALPVRLGARIEDVQVRSDGVTVALGDEVLRARALVVATEADAAATLLSRTMPEVSRRLASFEYAPITLVQWAEANAGDSRLPSGFGYLAAPVEKLFALGTLFISDLRGEPTRRFSTFVGGALSPERAALPDVALATGLRDDLTVLTGGTVGRVVNVVRWPRAVVQPRVGHLDDVAALHASLGGMPVALAGSYLGGAAMKDALHSGFAAAERLLSPSPRERGEGRGEGA